RHAGGCGRRTYCTGDRKAESLHRLSGRHQGVHGSCSRGNRKYPRRYAGWCIAWSGGNLCGRLYFIAVQGHRRLRITGFHSALSPDRPVGQARSGKSLMFTNVKNALTAAIMAGIIIAPIFGVQILRKGMHSELEADWSMIWMGMAIVF